MSFNNVFSIPVSHKHQTSMRRRFIVFSSVLFLFLFVIGSAAYIALIERIRIKSAGNELIQIIEIERLKLEASVNAEIAIILKMADSPMIKRHFLNPENDELQKFAFEEISGYRRAFAGHSIYWVNNKDKKLFVNDAYKYNIDANDPDNYWYLLTLNNTKKYNININYNPDLNSMDIWINAPVYDDYRRPIGILGTGVNLSEFINTVYQNYQGNAELYLVNAAGEITGANDIDLIQKKVNVTEALGQTGWKILAMTKEIKNDEIKYSLIKDKRQIAAIGSIPALNWYVIAVHSFSVGDSLQTGMTALFGIMMMVIFSVFVVFNVFIIGMLEPLNHMVKTVNQTLCDWELRPCKENQQFDEIGTLGEFLNMTIIDQLTGVYNRRYLDGHLKKIIRHLSRNTANISLLMMDIDYFKKYNDTYGHDAGDNCLRAAASALSQCITREDDFIARYGGEEFVIVLPNTGMNGAKVVAEKILEKMRECNIPHKASDAANYVTVSIGVTSAIVKHFHNGSDYIKCADKALYESKKNGRNRYTFNDFEDSEFIKPI